MSKPDKQPNPVPPVDDKKPEPVPPVDDKSDKPSDPPSKDADKVDVDAVVAAAVKKAQKEWEKQKEADEAKSKLSEDERLKAELAELRLENQMIKAESDVCEALKSAGAKSPKLLFNSSRGDLEFKDGKLANLADLVESLKTSYPEQFGVGKPDGTADGGQGNGEPPKVRADNLGSALKEYYKN